jgi:RimJ/RimL family protein N-acetyltransferase
MQFYPEDAVVPEGLRTDEFHLRPLRVCDAEIDYAAVMDSKQMLHVMSQSSWPSDDFTLEMNKNDLERHEKEHDERTAFTYTVLDPTESICLGCVYIKHLKEGPMRGDNVAMLRFWVRQSYLNRDLDRLLLKSLIDWFRNDWAFSRVVLTIADEDEKQSQLVTDLDLQLVHAYGHRWSEYLIKSSE